MRKGYVVGRRDRLVSQLGHPHGFLAPVIGRILSFSKRLDAWGEQHTAVSAFTDAITTVAGSP